MTPSWLKSVSAWLSRLKKVLMADKRGASAAEVLASYRAGGTQMYFIGLFNRGVTVLSQQIRALNLVWALVESKTIACVPGPDISDADQPAKRVAIIGGGFAGLTFAAGLVAKRANVAITIFEQRDTLLPLQQGSDSRWLHPRIYDWPREGSEANAAMLPLLNWTAARASDVVVQALGEWKDVVGEAAKRKMTLTLYCNTRHLQVHRGNSGGALRIEWVGERREARDGTIAEEGPPAEGRQDDFDFVVLAVGFGPERDRALSYWRNETLAQPSLEQARVTYVVSGQGDGAIIDLLRLRVSQFRQDRILGELFQGKETLLAKLRELQKEYAPGSSKTGMFDALEELGATHKEAFKEVRNDLVRRLRRDTDAVLRLKVKTFSELFEPKADVRISFQNRLLVYLLYKCGGFAPTHVPSDKLLMRQHGISREQVIRRHGPQPKRYVHSVLSDDLYSLVVPDESTGKKPAEQGDDLRWPGGYFGFPGPADAVNALSEDLKAHRIEYLPGPTELLATAFCSNVAGMLLQRHPPAERLRVTLHRLAVFGVDEMLQQACEYVGTVDAAGSGPAAARVFPAGNATIGVAYRCQQIVRSVRGVDPSALNHAMQQLNLNEASRKMSEKVRFVLAVPVLAPLSAGGHRVIAVAYLDSMADKFFIEDGELGTITSMTLTLFRSLIGKKTFKRLTNAPIAWISNTSVGPEPLPPAAMGCLELVASVPPPRLDEAYRLNFDYTDFIPV